MAQLLNTITLPILPILFLVLGLLANQAKADNSQAQAALKNKGALVMVGGALRDSSDSIFQAMIDKVGGIERAKVMIIPAASSKPSKYGQLFIDKMIAIGLKPQQVTLLPIALSDDSSTKTIDESTWANNGHDKALASKVLNANMIWFTGGDQTKIIKTLANTPVLNSIKQIYQEGAVIGGTSAGAAIMSQIMIASGDSLHALQQGFTDKFQSMNEQESGPVYLTQGLGFFTQGIIDQHFDRKARLGRLIAVLHQQNNTNQLGYGIDEDTALVYDSKTNQIKVLGEGTVTIVDISQAQISRNQTTGISANNIDISILSAGDRYNLSTKNFTPHSNKVSTIGHELFELEKPLNTGVLNRNSQLKHFLTYDLIDNKGATQVKSYIFGHHGQGFELLFKQTKTTQGYWGYLDGMKDFYSAFHIKLSIKPVTVNIQSR